MTKRGCAMDIVKSFIQKKLILAACLASVSSLALVRAAEAQTSAGSIQPSYGTISPFYGTLSPFYGKLSPFYGKLSPFYGTISPFYGKISPFYGKLSPFYGKISPFTATTDTNLIGIYGAGVDPFWGATIANPYKTSPNSKVNYSGIADFWDTTGTDWSNLQTNWQVAATDADYAAVAAALQTKLLNPSAAFWGKAVNGSTTPSKFTASAASLLNANGITLNTNGTINAASLKSLDASQQQMFFLNYYDWLNGYTGTKRVDWWMGATNWTPALSYTAGTMTSSAYLPAPIGFIDFTVLSATASQKAQKAAKTSLLQFGSDVFSNGHGAAVEGLVVGTIDGSNISGVLPYDSTRGVMVYDPYDSTGTTSWADVGAGITALNNKFLTWSNGNARTQPLHLINASLGEPGFALAQCWNNAFVNADAKSLLMVIAAGNDGITQTQNVNWNFTNNPNILVVGSIGLDGTISNFSNTPGEACLINSAVDGATCKETDKLKYRFLVAPGELILVSDGSGHVSRQSGTSLAAPLVTGAVGLLWNRWPWLSNYTSETAQILLSTATKRGTNPGADAIYGAGVLNIQASQSPINWDKLTFSTVTSVSTAATATTEATTTLVKTAQSVSALVGTIKSGNQAQWNTAGLYIVALEPIGKTNRDFQIPLASALMGQKVCTGGGKQATQGYLTSSLITWAKGHSFEESSPTQRAMLGLNSTGIQAGEVAGFKFRFNLSPSEVRTGYRMDPASTDMTLSLSDDHQALTMGHGQGAAVLGQGAGFAQSSDYDVDSGGANALLGLASGGAFVGYRADLSRYIGFNIGVTQRQDQRDPNVFGPDIAATSAATYKASAAQIGLDLAVVPNAMVHLSATRLSEDKALLGQQSRGRGIIDRGATTVGTTAGVDLVLPARMGMSAAVTKANSHTLSGQGLSTGPDGITSTSSEVVITKAGIFEPHDGFRLSISQPMHVTQGSLRFSTYGVVDRETGALGILTQKVSAATKKVPMVTEMLYARPIKTMGANLGIYLKASSHTVFDYDTSGINYEIGSRLSYSY